MTQSSLVYAFDAGYYAFIRDVSMVHGCPDSYTPEEVESWLDGYQRAREDRSRSRSNNRSNY